MTLTRDFHETIVARAHCDPKFARALLDEAATLFVNGEPELAKTVLRNLVNATVGFEALAQAIDKPPKSVHRVLSSLGNPTMSNLAAIFSTIGTTLIVEFRARVTVA
jgi:DNA-binding phage protein